MNRLISLPLVLILAAPALGEIIAKPRTAQPAANTATEKFGQVLGRALQHLGRAENYVLRVESKWKATGDVPGQEGQSNYRLITQGKKYRIEVQSAQAAAPQLFCVSDGTNITTLLASQSLYSRHAVDSPKASLESNTMLAMSLAGSAIDILLQPNVAGYVGTQATDLKDLGETQLGGERMHAFEVQWAGARVQIYFAAEGDPLLKQFTRIAVVPTGENSKYEMVHTARFEWQLNARLPEGTFALTLPKDAHRCDDIYDALSGDDPAARIGKPLPKLELTQLDGTSVPIAAPRDKRALVLIFWATWCTDSTDDLAGISRFVKAYQQKGVNFYAVNVGEEPGEVRRFMEKSPLASAVVLDPKGTASSALRVSCMPAVVVVNPDNTVRAIHQGEAQQVQSDLAATLDKLLAEPAATARRPGEATAPK